MTRNTSFLVIILGVIWISGMSVAEVEPNHECDGRVADSVEKLNACTDDLVALKSSSKTKHDELLNQIQALEKEEKRLRAAVESEKKSCSAKVQSLGERLEREQRGNRKLESVLKELEQIKSSWLPVWMSKYVEKLEPILSEARPYAEKALTGATRVWRMNVLPLVLKGRKLVHRGYSIGMHEVGRAWKTYAPRNLREYVHQGHKALSLSLDTISKYSILIKSQVAIVVEEISAMVKTLADSYPDQFGWAGRYSVAIATFILCFPITFIAMPMLASRRNPAAGSKKKQKKKKNPTKSK